MGRWELPIWWMSLHSSGKLPSLYLLISTFSSFLFLLFWCGVCGVLLVCLVAWFGLCFLLWLVNWLVVIVLGFFVCLVGVLFCFVLVGCFLFLSMITWNTSMQIHFVCLGGNFSQGNRSYSFNGNVSLPLHMKERSQQAVISSCTCFWTVTTTDSVACVFPSVQLSHHTCVGKDWATTCKAWSWIQLKSQMCCSHAGCVNTTNTITIFCGRCVTWKSYLQPSAVVILPVLWHSALDTCVLGISFPSSLQFGQDRLFIISVLEGVLGPIESPSS